MTCKILLRRVTLESLGLTQGVTMSQLFMLFLAHAYGGQAQPLKPGATVPQLIMDGPWRWLWPCLLPWIPFQIAISLGWLQNAVGGQSCLPLLCLPCQWSALH